MTDQSREAFEDIQLIRNVAGDLDHGVTDGGKIRGNIGGPVSRACDRLQAALLTRPETARQFRAADVDVKLSELALFMCEKIQNSPDIMFEVIFDALVNMLNQALATQQGDGWQHFDKWHEDFGTSVAWAERDFHLTVEPLYVGCPLDSDWPFSEADEKGLYWFKIPNGFPPALTAAPQGE